MAQSTEPITVTLPPETSAMIRARIESGEYVNEIDVINHGVAALEVFPPPLEPWQVEEVLAACAEYDADPSSGFTSEQMKARLEAEYELLLKAS
jgi:Arc/MetJ-type ribon-helix-helix transcriptional regulator